MERDFVEMELQLPREHFETLQALAEDCGVTVEVTAEALLVAGLLDEATDGRRQFVRTYKMLRDLAGCRPPVKPQARPQSQPAAEPAGQPDDLRESLRQGLPDGLPAAVREKLLDLLVAGMPAGARVVTVEICRERNGGGN